MYETTKFVLSLLLDSNAQLLFRSGNTEECTFLYIFNDYNLWSHQLLSSIRIVSTYISIDTLFLMKNLHDVQNILSRYSNTDIKISKASYSISVCIFLRHTQNKRKLNREKKVLIDTTWNKFLWCLIWIWDNKFFVMVHWGAAWLLTTSTTKVLITYIIWV